MYNRALHVVEENQRVLDTATALKENDIKKIGEFNKSHNSLRDLYEVSCKELDSIVNIARKIPGVYGARMIGGGFGGCALVIIDPLPLDNLIKIMKEEYQKENNLACDISNKSLVIVHMYIILINKITFLKIKKKRKN